MKKTSIVIIGAGIAGISASLYLKRENMDFVLLENNKIGGLLNDLHEIQNYPAVANTNGQEVLSLLKKQLQRNKINVTYGSVQTILKSPEGFDVITDVESYSSKVVIVATGNAKQEKTIVGENKFVGLGVSYCATCDGNFFKGLDVAVVGNNNIAIEEALYLSNLVNRLYFVTNENMLNGDENLVSSLKSKKNIVLKTDAKVQEIIGDDLGVTGLKINGEILNVSAVFPYIGNKSASTILNNLKPAMINNHVVVNENCMSNIVGLYAAGDIVDKKIRQLITAASDGALAATDAINYCKRFLK